MSNQTKVQVKTRSYAWELPFVKASDLFTHASACDHSGIYHAKPSTFECELRKQGYVLSHALNGYQSGVTKHIFFKISPALQLAIDNSPYCGLPCEWVSLEEVGKVNDRRIMIKLTMVSRSGTYFTYDLMAGFLTLEDFKTLKESLNTKTCDHSINLQEVK